MLKHFFLIKIRQVQGLVSSETDEYRGMTVLEILWVLCSTIVLSSSRLSFSEVSVLTTLPPTAFSVLSPCLHFNPKFLITSYADHHMVIFLVLYSPLKLCPSGLSFHTTFSLREILAQGKWEEIHGSHEATQPRLWMVHQKRSWD